MKAATLNELKQELSQLAPKRVLEITLRLGRFKKENKELLTYLLFEAHEEIEYIKSIKAEIDSQLAAMNSSNIYLVKKSVRKILRTINKYIKYSGIKETEAELRIYYCAQLKRSGLPIKKSQQLINLYQNQLKKINMTIVKLHEDLQFDYLKEIENLAL
jgi:hypothetical protein